MLSPLTDFTRRLTRFVVSWTSDQKAEQFISRFHKVSILLNSSVQVTSLSQNVAYISLENARVINLSQALGLEMLFCAAECEVVFHEIVQLNSSLATVQNEFARNGQRMQQYLGDVCANARKYQEIVEKQIQILLFEAFYPAAKLVKTTLHLNFVARFTEKTAIDPSAFEAEIFPHLDNRFYYIKLRRNSKLIDVRSYLLKYFGQAQVAAVLAQSLDAVLKDPECKATASIANRMSVFEALRDELEEPEPIELSQNPDLSSATEIKSAEKVKSPSLSQATVQSVKLVSAVQANKIMDDQVQKAEKQQIKQHNLLANDIETFKLLYPRQIIDTTSDSRLFVYQERIQQQELVYQKQESTILKLNSSLSELYRNSIIETRKIDKEIQHLTKQFQRCQLK